MSTSSVTTAELRKMSAKDLQGEAREKRGELAKMRLGIRMQKEKDSARYRREKKFLARMLTVLGEKERAEAPTPPLKKNAKTRTLSAPNAK